MPVQAGVQRSAAYVFHGDKVIADIADRDDVGMIQGGRGPRLLNETAFPCRIGDGFGVQQLQGDRPIEARINGAMDGAHAAFAKLFRDGVMPEVSNSVA